MLPEYPKFKSLETADLPDLNNFVEDQPPKICEFAPANLYLWQDFDRPQLTLVNGNLCILINSKVEPPFFYEPLGNQKLPETIELCLKHAGKISRVSEDFLSLVTAPPYRIKCLRDQYDYVYLTKELAQLKGRKFDGKRNHINGFQRRHPEYQYFPLASTDKEKAIEVFEKWFEARKGTQFFSRLAYAAQKKALIRAFDLFAELNLIGGALSVDGARKGFILGSKLNADTAAIHFQYVDPEYRGITQILLWEACNRAFSKSAYLNLEQDLGIPGLRKAKLSYHPLRLEKKFELSLK